MSKTVRWNKTDESYPPKKESSSLLDSQDSTDEYEGMSPLAMGLLQAGASMMRNSGWRNTPMTTGEAIGHAIPAGIGGYYNQDMMNQQGEAEFYERQQAEEQARQAEEQARQQAKILEDQQKQKQAQINSAIDQLDLIDDTVINRGTKRMLKEKLEKGGESFESAMTTIIKLTSALKAGEPYDHPDFGFGQFNKEGEWKSIEKKDKSVAGVPTGTLEMETEKAKKVLTSQGITNVPELTQFLEVKPIGDSGVSIIFKDSKGNQILTEKDKESQQNTVKYVKIGAFKETNPNWRTPPNTINVSLDQNGKILGYQVEDPETNRVTYLGEHEKGWQQSKAEYDMLKTELLSKSEFEVEFKGANVPDGTVSVEVNRKTGKIIFKNEQSQEVSDPTTTVLALQDGESKDTYYYVVDKNTGEKIKKIDLKKKFETPIERIKWNVEQQEKEQKRKSVDALISDLEKDFGIDPDMLGYIKEKSLVDMDGAITQINDLYNKQYAKQENIKRGSFLLKKYGGDYNVNAYYQSDGKGGWAEYVPHSSTRLSGESGLRKEYNQLTRDFRVASRGVDGVKQGLAQKNGFGDIMAITSFRIMFEPNSVVREAEFEITSKGAGFWEDIKKNPQKWMDGDKLSDKARKSMGDLVDEYIKQVKIRADKHYDTYSKIAKDRGYIDNAGIQRLFSTYPKYDKGASGGASGNPDKPDGFIHKKGG